MSVLLRQVLNSFIYNVTQCRFIGYTMAALFVEVNSIFLHARKLIQMDGRIGFNSPLYRGIAVVNLVTFVCCRFAFSLTLITYGIIMKPWMMSTYYYWSLSLTMVLTWIVNIMLFWRLVKSDLLRRGRSSRHKEVTPSANPETSKKVAVNGNNNYKFGLNNERNAMASVEQNQELHHGSFANDEYKPKRS
jgi:hypothetical protein